MSSSLELKLVLFPLPPQTVSPLFPESEGVPFYTG